MNRTPRNLHLLSQLSDSNPFKKTMARAFDVADDYQKDWQSIFGKDERGNELRRDLSPEGKRGEAQKAIRRAIRDLRDLKKPVEEYHSKTESMRATAKRPTYDKTDVVAAMNRRELRELARSMSFGQRQMRMLGEHRDQNFIDAVLEHEAWVTGFDVFNPNELQIYEEARQDRLRDLNPALLDTIAARESIESEAMMIVNMVRGDIAADSGLEPREFEAEAKRIETKADGPWVMEDKKTICELVNGKPEYRLGSPDELRDGREYPNLESYLAARAA